MENSRSNYTYESVFQDKSIDISKRFIADVFLWMFIGLAISAAVSLYFAANTQLLSYLINPVTGRRTGLGTIVTFIPLVFVLVMSFGLHRLSFAVLATLFVLFATAFGMSMSFIFLVYTSSSIMSVFITASLLFGVMAIAGYTTSQDLTKFGSLLMMALIGLIIAGVVNFFLQSPQFSYILSFIGVAIFVGLTAYDMQKLKQIGASVNRYDASVKRLVIMGALTLYLDFINIFLNLLRLFGSRK
ncbi:Bax inhibitor-1/YccA family protein [Hufsiella ginkgonis]|uniref:BAX inhibitor (BI)-1/YccA family protein n=1 Tax=Hufsiella ginkgonis TaxID=2695274 RepID=A0A7K1XRW1_9SPHI|nr:Bax inhibitor-1/YccA family protein [Hufsiella ginkgonis]MXV13731.1 BAX inhibitor (BI)-1/YccA family protein [Hufsiella ginkgonis]